MQIETDSTTMMLQSQYKKYFTKSAPVKEEFKRSPYVIILFLLHTTQR